MIINNENKKVLSKGEGFGELALLYNSKRSAPVRTLKPCKFYGIDRKTFRSVIEDLSLK